MAKFDIGLHSDHPPSSDVDVGRFNGDVAHSACFAVTITLGGSESLYSSISCAGTFKPWTYDCAHYAHAVCDLRVLTASLQPIKGIRMHAHVLSTISNYRSCSTHFQSRPQEATSTCTAAVAYVIPVGFQTIVLNLIVDPSGHQSCPAIRFRSCYRSTTSF